MTGEQAKPLVTAEELANLWEVSRTHIYVMMREQGLPSIKLGRRRRFQLTEANEWLTKQRNDLPSR